MVIVTKNNVAVMYYSESQWLDACDANFGTGVSAYRVPNSTLRSKNILHRPEEYMTIEETGKFINQSEDEMGTYVIEEPSRVVKVHDELLPMTEEEVKAIATETLTIS